MIQSLRRISLTASLLAALIYIIHVIALSFNVRIIVVVKWSIIPIGLVTTILYIFRSSINIKKCIFCIVFNFFCIELILQLTTITGLLPISTYKHIPYGRAYWTSEGYSNTLMNRYGWHFPSLELETTSKKIVLIGDSCIQGIQVSPQNNIGILTQNAINRSAQKTDRTEIISLGLSGAGPAHYLELIKYAVKYFSPDECIIFIYLGNDFKNCSYKLSKDNAPPNSYIYYHKDSKGNIVLHPESIIVQKRLVELFEENHAPLSWKMIYTIARNYLMLPHVIKQLREKAPSFYDRINALRNAEEEQNRIDDPLQRGLQRVIRKKSDLNPVETEAIEIAFALLKKCHEYAVANNVTMRLVTIPSFSQKFYTQKQINFDYYLLYETFLIDFAAEYGIPILPMGKHMRDSNLSHSEIQKLYLCNGSGHLSIDGHKYFAETINDTFYPE